MKTPINTNHAPAAIGPYSQGIVFEKLIFTSGQLPLDPHTQILIEGNITEQAQMALTSLKAILENAGASLDTVLKTTCYLANMNDFSAFNDVYSHFFTNETAPARSCFEVARLPKDALIEIDAIAYIQNPTSC